MQSMQRKTHQFSYHIKGFLDYVFCRKWAVRNPAETRLLIGGRSRDVDEEQGVGAGGRSPVRQNMGLK